MLKREVIEKVIGKGFADKLDEPVMDLGSVTYSRREMVEELNCANFIAAVRLAKVLKKLSVRTPAQLYKMDPFSLARSRGIGEAALFVATCILDANEYSVVKWWGWNDNVVKFSTFKHNAMKRARQYKQAV